MAEAGASAGPSHFRSGLDRFLSSYDILLLVFEELYSITNPVYMKQRTPGKSSMAQAAISCKAFQNPSLDVLWRTIPDLLPLLGLLPNLAAASRTRLYAITGAVSKMSLERFEFYARRVRAVRWERGYAPYSLDVNVLLLFSSLLKRDSLLPNLRGIQVPTIDGSVSLLMAAASTSLQKLAFAEELRPGDMKSLAQFLQILPARSPNLEDLSLKGHISFHVLAYLEGCRVRNLTLNLTTPQYSEQDDFGRILDDFPELRQLDITITHTSFVLPQRSVASNRQQSRRLDLKITASCSNTISLLSYLSTATIEILGITLWEWELAEAVELLSHKALSRKDLRKLEISCSSMRMSESLDFKSLSDALPTTVFLESFSVAGVVIPRSTDDLRTFFSARTWTDLRNLDLRLAPDRHRLSTPKIDISFLRTLASLCPALNTLGFFLSTKGAADAVEDDLSSKRPMKHRLQEIDFDLDCNPGDLLGFTIAVSRYLDYLFPALQKVERSNRLSPLWGAHVFSLIKTYRCMRTSSRIAV